MQLEEGLVSIITPVYNAQKFIQATIESVCRQTYQNWELLLVDDASTDGSIALIEKLAEQDSRVKLLPLKVNQGAAVARNHGLAHAKGRYVAFVDADDYWLPDKLQAQLDFMQVKDYAFTYTNFALVDEAGQVLKDRVDLPQTLSYRQLLKNTAIACSTVVIDRHLLGDFRMPLVRKGQDTATWLYLMRERQVVAYGLDQVLNHYRQVKGSISSNRWSALKRTWHTYRHLEKLPLLECFYYFSHYVFQAILRRL